MTASADPTTVTVALADRSYPIHIGAGLISAADQWLAPHIKNRHIVIISDAAVDIWGDRLAASLSPAARVDRISTEGGEDAKSFARYEMLMNRLLDLGVDRTVVLIALGGGVIGDLVGFIAASLLRGVDFIQVPTTLLAQVDSSVGGKTGINANAGKNLVGAFHQPRAVLIDIACLDRLPVRQMLAGYAEVVKYGLLGDADFFGYLERHADDLLAQRPEMLIEAICHCCRAKAAIVAADEREAGQRALLNLGHTFAHAFEAESGYDGSVLHGEAVAAGMVHAFALSHRLGFSDAASCHRVASHLEAVGLPSWRSALAGAATEATPERLIGHMEKDKKARGGKLSFVLARGIGDAFVAADVNRDDVAAVLAAASLDEVTA